MARPLRVVRLGARPYQEVYALQQRLFDARKRGAMDDTILFVEHSPSVYTLGRRKEGVDDLLESEEALRARGVDVVKLNRGGRATWHGPGQLTFYPIVNFKELQQRATFRHSVSGLVHWWVRVLELTVLTFLWRQGLVGWTCDDVGVWLGGPAAAVRAETDRVRPPSPAVEGLRLPSPDLLPFDDARFAQVVGEAARGGVGGGEQRKVAAIGVQLSRYCSMHGVALNIRPDLDEYRGIVPCGLDAAVTSLAQELPAPPGDVMEYAPDIIAAFIDTLASQDAFDVVEVTGDAFLRAL
eukprot:TRINITY_DN6264_c0_g1_i1.p1 TRINITY_DN6264_c0_g1~~TRINITY_DN6264_c0_g1_i1.p1  ORF type:complete len:296 (+),score=100.83 TRINITY_DN6264_c0_g1_i1:51-938(+)